MRVCLVSPTLGERDGLATSVLAIGRALAAEHEVTIVHSGSSPPAAAGGDELTHLHADPEAVPAIAFSCEDHRRSAAVLAAIEAHYGERPPNYLEAPEFRGHGLVPLQARNAGHRSLKGTAVGVRLHRSAELDSLRDGDWPAPPRRMVFDLEREAMRLADAVLWPGGDALGLYRRVLGVPAHDRVVHLRPPAAFSTNPGPRVECAAGDPVRILCAGRLRRSRGALTLGEAALQMSREDWRLTIVGGDSQTAPLQQSVRATLEILCGGDERVELLDPVSREELRSLFADHDLLVIPATTEPWPALALEAMAAGLPVLAPATGGLSEIVVPGATGWRIDEDSPAGLARALEAALDDREGLARMRTGGAPAERARELGDPVAARAAYARLWAGLEPTGPGRRLVPGPPPRVTGIVTYFGESEEVGAAVDSLLAQTHPNLDVLIVDDGHFEPGDEVLAELAQRDRVRVLYQPNRGETGARNFAALDAEGEYLAVLDADNTFEPEFVERAVAMLEADPELAYVTCWLRFFDAGDGGLAAAGTDGFAALGNGVRSDESINSDGDTMAVMPRRLFSELGYRYQEDAALLADWDFYRSLREDGRLGTVIPELLARYRVRFDGLSRTYSGRGHAISWDESITRRRAQRRAWMEPA